MTKSRKDLSRLRENYTLAGFDVSQALADPLGQFGLWFDQAEEAGIIEPNALTLATTGTDGLPDARVVLLKGIDHEGFVFYTNYLSKKGQDLAHQPHAAMVFLWLELERQVRITGSIERVSEADSDAYFASRPRESQLGAWTSAQSQVICSVQVLQDEYQRLQLQYLDKPVPRPLHWGGYRLLPQAMEFWQGRPGRLHDRIRYRKTPDNWIIERLSP